MLFITRLSGNWNYLDFFPKNVMYPKVQFVQTAPIFIRIPLHVYGTERSCYFFFEKEIIDLRRGPFFGIMDCSLAYITLPPSTYIFHDMVVRQKQRRLRDSPLSSTLECYFNIYCVYLRPMVLYFWNDKFESNKFSLQ